MKKEQKLQEILQRLDSQECFDEESLQENKRLANEAIRLFDNTQHTHTRAFLERLNKQDAIYRKIVGRKS